MQAEVNSWIGAIWIAVAVFWALSALFTKRTVRAQSSQSRALYTALLAAGFLLLYVRKLDDGPLGQPFMPESSLVALLGLALTICGVAFGIWARISLGRNWSGTVTIKQGHELIRRGPYAMVRHPIYSGALLALAGTVIAFDQIRALMAFGFVTAALWLKLKTEEAFMQQQFGEQYREYMHSVKALIPYLL